MPRHVQFGVRRSAFGVRRSPFSALNVERLVFVLLLCISRPIFAQEPSTPAYGPPTPPPPLRPGKKRRCPREHPPRRATGLIKRRRKPMPRVSVASNATRGS